MTTTPKKLHEHTVPIVVLSVGLFIASVVSLQGVLAPHASSSAVLGDLVYGRLLKISPQTNGLASIEVNNPDTTPPPTGLGQLSNIGESTQLQVVVSGLSAQTQPQDINIPAN